MKTCFILIIIIVSSFCYPDISVGQVEFEYASSILYHDELNSNIQCGNIIYCSGDNGLHVMEITDDGSLEFRNFIKNETFGHFIEDDNVEDTRVFTHYGNSIKYLDISDTLNPVLHTCYTTQTGYIYYAKISNNIAYLGINHYDWWYGYVDIVDISNPENPVLLTTLETYPSLTALDVGGELLFVACSYDLNPNYLRIFIVSNPENPEEVCNIDLDWYTPLDIAVFNNYVFVSTYYDNIIAVDITELSYPVIVDTFDIYGIGSILVDGNVLYAFSSSGIFALDISDPTDLTQLGFYNCEANIQHATSKNNFIHFIASNGYQNETSAINVLDFTYPQSPELLDKFMVFDSIEDVQLSNNYAFVACGYSGLAVVNVLDPYNPEFVAQYGTPNTAKDIFIHDDYAYVTNSNDGLFIFNIADPESTEFISSYIFDTGIVFITVEDSLAYGLTYTSNPYNYIVNILNISNPEVPDLINTYDQLYLPNYIIVRNSIAYISCRYSLEIVDMSNPLNPLHISSHPYRDLGCGIDIQDTVLFAACGGEGLDIFNISNLEDPFLISTFGSSNPQAVKVHDNLVYLSCYNSIDLLDITDINHPDLILSYTDASSEKEVSVENDFIFIPSGSSLLILSQITTDVNDFAAIPENISTIFNYPNPFNASTTISYTIPYSSKITLDIYDILGRNVETLVNTKQSAGYHQIVWDAEDFSSGVYFYRLTAGEYSETKKMVLLK